MKKSLKNFPLSIKRLSKKNITSRHQSNASMRLQEYFQKHSLLSSEFSFDLHWTQFYNLIHLFDFLITFLYLFTHCWVISVTCRHSIEVADQYPETTDSCVQGMNIVSLSPSPAGMNIKLFFNYLNYERTSVEFKTAQKIRNFQING